MRNEIELLAPAGSYEGLVAAINAGADAVYIGGKKFGARAYADNPEEDMLIAGIRYAHLQGKKVYMTINTLLKEKELQGELYDYVKGYYEAGLDAVIVQDFGVFSFLKKHFPDLPLHASTQMTVTGEEAAKFLREQGAKRVVLARELSLQEVKQICEKASVEIECFVHGAICYCYSGQCLFSSFLGGRSGNRGRCAQPCRLDFTYGDRHSVLSLKDLSVIEKLPELERIGVTSAKIEGRMKRPEYVAAAVSACRDILSGKKADLDTLKAVFSRSGFTASYLNGSISDMQGVRTREDVTAAAPALKKLERLYEKPMKRHIVDIDVTAEAGKPVTAEVKCGRISFSYTSDIVPEVAVNRSITPGEICERLGKMGGTVFEAGKITASAEQGIMLSASGINTVRREILDRISEILITKEGL